MTPSWDNARNILCIRLDAIGDVIMTTPAMRAIKSGHPDRQITLLTSSSGAAIAPLIAEVDRVIVHDAPWLKTTALPDPSSEFALIKELQELQFDAAVIFTVYSQNPLPSAFLCYLAKIPLRLAHCHENPYQLLTNWVKDPEPEPHIRHEVQRQLDLVETIGCTLDDPRLKLTFSDTVLEKVHDVLYHAGISFISPWMVIHPGSTAASRRYSPEQFAIVASRLTQEFGVQIIFTGTASELSLVDFIQSKMSVCSISLVNALNLQELAALLSFTPVFITNNTGPMHIAAAVQTPTVALYALTNPQHTPWMVPHQTLFHDVPCCYCYQSICPEDHHLCLQGVTPDRVVQAAIELLTNPKSTALSPSLPCSTSSSLPIIAPLP
jgi:lipopolysaccharide heptosyltransferase II